MSTSRDLERRGSKKECAKTAGKVVALALYKSIKIGGATAAGVTLVFNHWWQSEVEKRAQAATSFDDFAQQKHLTISDLSFAVLGALVVDGTIAFAKWGLVDKLITHFCCNTNRGFALLDDEANDDATQQSKCANVRIFFLNALLDTIAITTGVAIAYSNIGIELEQRLNDAGLPHNDVDQLFPTDVTTTFGNATLATSTAAANATLITSTAAANATLATSTAAANATLATSTAAATTTSAPHSKVASEAFLDTTEILEAAVITIAVYAAGQAVGRAVKCLANQPCRPSSGSDQRFNGAAMTSFGEGDDDYNATGTVMPTLGGGHSVV